MRLILLFCAPRPLSTSPSHLQSRPQLLDMGTVTVFMACSEADNVAGQLASAKALGNFALDEKGRTVMKDRFGRWQQNRSNKTAKQ